ncbi:MAG: aminodeoxychorismate/anthranilate synthase component II [Opitutaceae bacterium]|nr:aminodeoxychorismate/anthranilate synthase component II [Cytophagales bacterium]
MSSNNFTVNSQLSTVNSQPKILVLDNYDSFTYNLVHLVKALGFTDVEVHRNDKIDLADIERFDKIILSPGPGVPSEAGLLLDVIREYAGKKPILGVCLGHQAIGEAFGGNLTNLSKVYHGVATKIKLTKPEDSMFKDLPVELEVGRYHSWVIDREGFPEDIEITAEDEGGFIMALSHKKYDIKGVQFHPESILTPEGSKLMENWLKN